jgi:hypothetical protein
MRQALFNSLPTHVPEKLRPPAFFRVHSESRVAPTKATAELRSAWTGEGARPHTDGITPAEVSDSGYDSSSPSTKY